VRDIYAVGDDRLLLAATDRISAFDAVMAEAIPLKGVVLTQISAWRFRQLEGVVAARLARCRAPHRRWNGEAPPPLLPPEIVAATSDRYRDAFRPVTGKALDPGAFG
jgi:phosphoribosylaminoimidazole-succinocarboxamide synthase